MLQANLKKLQVESNKWDAKLYANMFDRMAKESDAVSKVTSFIFCVSYSLLYESIGTINSTARTPPPSPLRVVVSKSIISEVKFRLNCQAHGNFVL
jgi:hypothetical protein